MKGLIFLCFYAILLGAMSFTSAYRHKPKWYCKEDEYCRAICPDSMRGACSNDFDVGRCWCYSPGFLLKDKAPPAPLKQLPMWAYDCKDDEECKEMCPDFMIGKCLYFGKCLCQPPDAPKLSPRG
uniref:Formate dehydrogenase subunit beta n=1 Tax=Lygus hesperus TaxID=30085 RepID=A0A0A9X281_LYGHE